MPFGLPLKVTEVILGRTALPTRQNQPVSTTSGPVTPSDVAPCKRTRPLLSPRRTRPLALVIGPSICK